MDLKLHYLPVLMIVILQITLATTFYLACFYYDDHVTYFLPYISDTGTFPPESCIFGQALNVVVLILGCIIYIKYKQINEIFYKHNITGKNKINKLAKYVGYLACIGLDIVANFQETNCLKVHWTGALLAFGCGAIYLCLQSYLYVLIAPIIGQRKLTKLRIVLSIISTVTFVVFSSASFIAFSQFEGKDFTKWKKEDGGYDIHQISTNSEWICAGTTIFYILLIYPEFKNISIESPKIVVHEIREVKDSGQRMSIEEDNS